jgi:hypothetical protein
MSEALKARNRDLVQGIRDFLESEYRLMVHGGRSEHFDERLVSHRRAKIRDLEALVVGNTLADAPLKDPMSRGSEAKDEMQS